MRKNIKELYKKIKVIKDVSVFKNEPLSRHTTFKIGGPAELLVTPKSIDGLKKLIETCSKFPITILGNGSNILASDRGIKGVVLKIVRGLNAIEIDRNIVKVGSGVLISKLLNQTVKAGLSGIEFSAGIPASIGGALVTNMGAFGKSISTLVREIIIINKNGKEMLIKKKDMRFKYRNAGFLRNKGIIVSAVLVLRRAKSSYIRKKIKKYLTIKKGTQPIYVPSGGCVFKNPKNDHAGKLIEQSECKGLRVGGAEISKTHANYIINLGDATCADVKKLAEKVRDRVEDKFGIRLRYEIIDSNHLNVLS